MRRGIVPSVVLAALVFSVLSAPPASAVTITAKSLLAKLSVRAEAGSSSYARAKFRFWIDADRDGCDTREEVLLAESRTRVRRGRGCSILAGTWFSPYDGRSWRRPSDVEVDHAVPLKEAWESGARSWTASGRMKFANDLGYAWSIDTVTDNLKASRRDRDVAGWLPPRQRCRYAVHWVAVKYRWRLSVNAAEKNKLASLLSGTCGSKRLTVPRRVWLATILPAAAAATPGTAAGVPGTAAAPPPAGTAAPPPAGSTEPAPAAGSTAAGPAPAVPPVGGSTVTFPPPAAVPDNNRFTAADLPSYQTNGIAWAVAQVGGRVFVGGSFSSVRPSGAAAGSGEVGRVNFAVFNAATGALDGCAPRFELASSPSSAVVRSLRVSPDGRTLYVGGFFTSIDGGVAQHLAAIDVGSCAVVSAFRPAPGGMVRAIAASASSVYFGGTFGSAGGQVRANAAAVAAVGTGSPGALLGWAPAFDKDVRALVLKPDTSVVVAGGDFDHVNGVHSHALAVLDAGSGALVGGFGSLIHPVSVVMDLAVDASGFYTAHEGRGPGVMDGRMAFEWSFATRWVDACLGATQAVEVYDGILYSGSHAHDCTPIGAFPDGPRTHLLAQSVTDPRLLAWFPDTDDGIGEALGPRDVVAARTTAGDFLWVVGEFTTVNGRPQQGITRFGQTAHTVGPSVPQLSVTYPSPGQARVAWRAALDRDDASLTYRLYRDGALVHTTTATSWFWSRRQLTFTDTGLGVGSWHSYRVEVSDATNTSSTGDRWVQIGPGTSSGYAERVLADGASFLWRYDDPLDVLVSDRTAHNNNGTVRGQITKTGGALAGDPSLAITLPGGPAALGGASGSTTIYSETRYPAPAAFTAETWFKTTTTAGGKLIGFGSTQIINSWDSDRHIWMRNDGTLTFGAGPGALASSPRPYNDGAWHHLAATQGPSGMALYLDGALVATHSETSGRSFSGFWRVGGDNLSFWPGESSNHYFNGTLDETAVYPSALSASTIAAHYALGNGSAPRDTTAPSAPTNLAATPSGSTVNLSWTAATDNVAVTGYNIHRSSTFGFTAGGSTLIGSTAGTSFADSPVAPGTWYYLVVAKDAVGNESPPSLPQARAQVAQPADTSPPSSPAGLVLGVSGSTVNISWSASSDNLGVAGYDIHRSPTSGFSPSSATLTGSSAATNFRNSAVPPGTWYYRVVAKDAAGNASSPSAQASTTVLAPPDTTAPTPPTEAAANASGTTVTVSWAAATDNVAVTSYDVHRAASSGFAPTGATLIGSAAGTSFVNSSVPEGVWYYRVVAKDAAGNASGPSATASIAIVGSASAPSTSAGASHVSAVTQLAVRAAWARAVLTWSNPSDPGFTGVMVRRTELGAATGPNEGIEVYRGTGATVTATGWSGARSQVFTAFAFDGTSNYSAPTAVTLYGSTMSLSRAPTAVTDGNRVTHRVTLTGGHVGAALAGANARLYRRALNTTTWSLACSTTTSALGRASCVTAPRVHTYYEWRFLGRGEQSSTRSKAYRLLVHNKVTASVNRTNVAPGSSFTIAGSVSPRHAGKKAYLQRYYRGSWQTIARDTLSSTSSYSFRVRPSRTLSYRVYKTGDTNYKWGFSRTRRVVVG